MPKTLQFAPFLYPLVPLPAAAVEVGSAHKISGSFEDFDTAPAVFPNRSTSVYDMRLKDPTPITHVVLYVVQSADIPKEKWVPPKVSIVTNSPDAGSVSQSFVFNSDVSPFVEHFCVAPLPPLGNIASLRVTLTMNAPTRVTTVMLVPGTTLKALATEHRAAMLAEFSSLLATDKPSLKFNTTLQSSLPGEKGTVQAHRFPLAVLSNKIAKVPIGEPIRLALSLPVIERVRAIAYGDFTAILDRSITPAKLVMGAGEVGPHVVPPSVLVDFGAPAVFLMIGRLLDSTILIEAACHAMAARNLFAVDKTSLSWLLHHGGPCLEPLILDRIKRFPHEIESFDMKDPLLAIVASLE